MDVGAVVLGGLLAVYLTAKILGAVHHGGGGAYLVCAADTVEDGGEERGQILGEGGESVACLQRILSAQLIVKAQLIVAAGIGVAAEIAGHIAEGLFVNTLFIDLFNNILGLSAAFAVVLLAS